MPSLPLTLVGLLFVVGLADAQAKISVVTPDPALVVYGRSLPIQWEGGRRPFALSLVKADNLSHTLSSLHGRFWSWEATYTVEQQPGTSISIRVEDLEGQTAFSAPLLVLSKDWAPGTTSDALAEPSSAPSTAIASPTAPVQPPESSSSLTAGNIGGIVGGILAGVAIVCVAVAVFVYHRRQSISLPCFGLRRKVCDEVEAKDVPLATIAPFAAGPTPPPSPMSSVMSFDVGQTRPAATI